jgi:hypothetical protein
MNPRYKITHGPGGPSIEPDLDYEETENNGWREFREDDLRFEMNEEDRKVSE